MWLISLAEINEEYRGLRQFYERLEHLNSVCVSSHASVILMCEKSYLCTHYCTDAQLQKRNDKQMLGQKMR